MDNSSNNYLDNGSFSISFHSKKGKFCNLIQSHFTSTHLKSLVRWLKAYKVELSSIIYIHLTEHPSLPRTEEFPDT